MNLLPVLAVGAVAIFATRKRRKKKKAPALPVPPEAPAISEVQQLGELQTHEALHFDGEDAPDLIAAYTGQPFTIRFEDRSGSTGYEWSLAASPPDNSVEFIGQRRLSSQINEQVSADISFDFMGQKPGEGALVFHHQPPWLKGQQQPEEVVEIQTKIS